MVLEQDGELICKMLGVLEIPAPVEREYELRIAFYHKSAASGPLGAIGIIDMLRFLDLRPAVVSQPAAAIDWSRVRTGVRIEASYFGQWIEGVFRGQLGSGMLAVQFGEKTVELHRGACRLADAKAVVEAVPPRAALLEPPAIEAKPVDKIETAECEREQTKEDVARPAIEMVSPGVPKNWSAVPSGTRVKADGQSGEVVRYEDPWLVIRFDGQPSTCKKLAKKSRLIEGG